MGGIKTEQNSRSGLPPTELISTVTSICEWHVHPDAQPETKGTQHAVSYPPGPITKSHRFEL